MTVAAEGSNFCVHSFRCHKWIYFIFPPFTMQGAHQQHPRPSHCLPRVTSAAGSYHAPPAALGFVSTATPLLSLFSRVVSKILCMSCSFNDLLLYEHNHCVIKYSEYTSSLAQDLLFVYHFMQSTPALSLALKRKVEKRQWQGSD